jgi:NTE family protein
METNGIIQQSADQVSRTEKSLRDPRLNKHAKSSRIMSTVGTSRNITRSYLVQNVNMNSIGVQPADVVIEPDVTEFGMTGFSRADELATVGEADARQEIPNIKHLLKQLDAKLF